MDGQVWSKAVFQLSEESDVQGSFEGFHTGDDWNGWACPYFTQEVGMQIVEAMNKVQAKTAEFDGKRGLFRFVAHDGDSTFEDEDMVSEFESVLVNVEGKQLTLWGIGAGSWIWKEVPSHNFLGYERGPGNRLFRFACECGAVGKWRVSKAKADLDFTAHKQAPDEE